MDPRNIVSKTIVITGASSGIGRALALHLAGTGHKVIAIGRNNTALDAMVHSHPNNIKSVIADITKSEDRAKIKESLEPTDSGIYLVHNAGIATPSLLADMTEESWDQHQLVNTKAPLFLTQLLLPYLKNGGRILNISTGLAHNPLSGFSAYGVSKAGLFMLKEFCNAELAAQDIVCSSAMPGIVDTPIQEKIRSSSITALPAVSIFQGFKQRDELLTPDDAAKFLAWLLIETSKDEFKKGEWDIYDKSHHQYWAQDCNIKDRNVPK